MDAKGRKANKRYRSKTGDTVYVTTSFKLDSRLLEEISKIIQESESKNMSAFIEQTVSPVLKLFKQKKSSRHNYKSFPVKKTLSFTKDFFSKIRKHENMSYVIETILIQELKLNLK